ncbi:site-specific DNA-methyltransferase [Streptococcus equi]
MAEAGRPTPKTLRPDLEESVNFEDSENVFITGDNLEVLKILQESYLNKIDMIYIDPPYNTGKDFVYSDKFQKTSDELAEDMDLYDDEGNQRVGLTKNEKSSARYHSDWLNMMYPRLVLARNLLKDNGVIFISIDDNEQANLKQLCDEVFGEENFIDSYIWESTFRPDNSSQLTRKNAEFVLVYLKNRNTASKLIGTIEQSSGLPSLTKNSMKVSELFFKKNIVTTYLADGIYIAGLRESGYELLDTVEVRSGKIISNFRIKGRVIWGQKYLEKQLSEGTEIIIKSDSFVPYSKKADTTSAPNKLIPRSIVGDVLEGRAEVAKLFNKSNIFSYPKPTSLLKYLQKTVDSKDIVILDFFAGSATTADAVMQLNAEDGGNRKYILCTLDEEVTEKSAAKEAGYETIDQISRERIRRAAKKIQEENPDLADKHDFGFKAYKLDSSNFKDIAQTPDTYSQQDLFDSISNIKEDRSDLDILFQIMLSWGMELSLKVEGQVVRASKIYDVDNGSLIACLSDEVTEDVIRQIAHKEPLRAVFKDDSFANSADKINLAEIFKEISPMTKVKVV